MQSAAEDFVAQTHGDDQEAQREAIREARASVLPRIVETGVEVSQTIGSDTNSSLEVSGSVEMIRAVARVPGVDNVLADVGTTMKEDADPTEPAQYTEAPTAAWPVGVMGTDEVVGVLDVGPCKILETHNVFASGGIRYYDPNYDVTCGSNQDCITRCSGKNDVCRNGKCVHGHGQGVASVVAQVAPNARIAYANGFNTGDYDVKTYRQAYEYFLQEGATIVNQSFRDKWGMATSKVQGIVEDEYARRFGMLVTQSAGNNESFDGAYADQEPACPYNLNALCVGAHNQAGRKSCYSDYANPGTHWVEVPDDREEPDLLTYGGDNKPKKFSDAMCPEYPGGQAVRTASFVDEKTYDSKFYGTSLAAPAAAGAAALAREFCRKNGTNLDGLGLRTLLMFGATDNAEDGRYSTLKPGDDWRDGAGGLNLNVAFGVCRPGLIGAEVNFETNPGDLGDGAPLPRAESPSPYPHTPPQSIGVFPLDQSSALGSDDTKVGREMVLGSLKEGQRVRAVLSWNGCFGHTVAPGKIGTDYDLLLWNSSDAYPYFSS